jgi:hypothetical protein
MRARFRFARYALAAALVTSVSAAQVGSALCEKCHEEDECEIEVYPCGYEPDGTVFFCSRLVCEPVVVCIYEPCFVDGDFELPPLESFPPFESLPPFLH